MASSTSSQLRLMSDLKAIKNEPPEGCSASPLSDDNLFVWSATIFGPDETPWEGGVFGLRLTFGDNYPAKPPRVRFTSEIFHPNGTSWVQDGYVYLQRAIMYNPPVAKPPLCLKVHWICVCIVCYSLDKYVYTDGTLCIDIIQDAWSPCHNVCTILSSIQSLLTDPNPASPANPEAAQLFQHDIQAYNKRVRRCARRSIES